MTYQGSNVPFLVFTVQKISTTEGPLDMSKVNENAKVGFIFANTEVSEFQAHFVMRNCWLGLQSFLQWQIYYLSQHMNNEYYVDIQIQSHN